MKTLNKEEYGYGIVNHIKHVELEGRVFDFYSCEQGVFVEVDNMNNSAFPVGSNMKEALRWVYMYIEGV